VCPVRLPPPGQLEAVAVCEPRQLRVRALAAACALWQRRVDRLEHLRVRGGQQELGLIEATGSTCGRCA
jgi:hypothetical protein